MKRLLKRLHTASNKGQSLVEMAIIAPILIFFLLGTFEVGWALRSYLVLVNINREITRFAIRPGYMDFSSEAEREKSYDRVKEWAETTVSDQLDLDFDKNTTLIISHLVIDTGLPCENINTCNCNWFNPNDGAYDPTKAFTKDDIIIHPGMSNYKYQTITFGITQTVTGEKDSRLDYDSITAQLTDQNNRFNCEIMKKGGLASANNMIATELFHDQPQLFGFPVISNPFTDPLPLYTHTVMRLIGGARASGGVEGSLIANIDAIGEICFAYPFIVSETTVNNTNPGHQMNILDGGGGSDMGWLAWDQSNNSLADLEYELQYPQMSVNSYHNPSVPTDNVLNPGDKVASLPGDRLLSVLGLVEGLAGQVIYIPVYDNYNSGIYTVNRFIRVSIVGGITPPEVKAVYLGDDVPEACQASPSP